MVEGPQPDTLPTPIRPDVKEFIPNAPLEVVITSSSPRRIEAIKTALQIEDINIVDGGDEDESLTEANIANRKLEYGRGEHRRARGYVEEALWKAYEANTEGNVTKVYFAGDVRNGPWRKNAHGVNATESIPKPKSLEEIRQVFVNMLDAATDPDEQHTHDPYYALRAGSGVLVDKPGQDSDLYSSYHTSTIMLNPMMIDYLSTDTGFEKYLAEAEKLHTSELYEEVGKKEKPEGESMLLHIAGGIDLPVLMRMGAITEIDGIKISEPAFREKLRETLYTALVGISEKALDFVDPQASTRLKEWAWMNKMTDYAMEGIKTSQISEEQENQAVA